MAFSDLILLLKMSSDATERWEVERVELLSIVSAALSQASRLTQQDKDMLVYLSNGNLDFQTLFDTLSNMKTALENNDMSSFRDLLRTLKEQMGW